MNSKTAIITGGSRGIGLAIAQRHVKEGARVVIVARGSDALDEAVHQLGSAEHAIAASRAQSLTCCVKKPRGPRARP